MKPNEQRDTQVHTAEGKNHSKHTGHKPFSARGKCSVWGLFFEEENYILHN